MWGDNVEVTSQFPSYVRIVCVLELGYNLALAPDDVLYRKTQVLNLFLALSTKENNNFKTEYML